MAEEASREADRRKDEFLATLAHELRNPLAPIRNALEVQRLAGDDRPAVERSRQMMERQLRQMVRLVDDLLDVSRITRGKLELQRERVDLAAVVGSALETSRPLIDASKHQISVSLPQRPLTLEADAVRLAQVVSNLLNNAAKYTPEGGRIWLSAEAEAGSAVIRVRDTGLGIPGEMLGRVFDMFMQMDQSLERAQGGLGIGLTLVKRLVEMHGGTVEAHSDGPGKGSELVVRLPLAAGEAETDALARAAGDARKQPPPSRRILVVDDNQDSADTLAMLLELHGNEVQVAYDGPEALAAARDFGPEVVFLDIGLPGMDGYEVARQMRAEPLLGKAMLVAQTGWGQEEDKQRALDAGFDHHLTKPVDPAALDGLLASYEPGLHGPR
jgi:CheY-like chemotaxis protein/two-component sensor histidine kinase